jgi:hypothetical protein
MTLGWPRRPTAAPARRAARITAAMARVRRPNSTSAGRSSPPEAAAASPPGGGRGSENTAANGSASAAPSSRRSLNEPRTRSSISISPPSAHPTEPDRRSPARSSRADPPPSPWIVTKRPDWSTVACSPSRHAESTSYTPAMWGAGRWPDPARKDSTATTARAAPRTTYPTASLRRDTA